MASIELTPEESDKYLQWRAQERERLEFANERLTLNEAADYLSLSPQTVRELDIPYSITPNSVGTTRPHRRYIRKNLDAWEKMRTVDF